MATAQKSSIDYRDLLARAIRIGVVANVLDTNGHLSARDEIDPTVTWLNNPPCNPPGAPSRPGKPASRSSANRFGGLVGAGVGAASD